MGAGWERPSALHSGTQPPWPPTPSCVWLAGLQHPQSPRLATVLLSSARARTSRFYGNMPRGRHVHASAATPSPGIPDGGAGARTRPALLDQADWHSPASIPFRHLAFSFWRRLACCICIWEASGIWHFNFIPCHPQRRVLIMHMAAQV